MKKLFGFMLFFLLMTSQIALPCTSIVAGKLTTVDGSVLFGHNEDDSGRRVVNIWLVPRKIHQKGDVVYLIEGGQVPQVQETWAYIWFQMNGLKFSDQYMNEWGVTIASDACSSREDQPDLTDGGISYMLRRMVAERAKTARQGVEIAGALLDQFGYASSGRTMVICDNQEGWLLSIVGGKHWVAQRVPDDKVVVLPNTYVTRQVDFKDSKNFITSKDNIRDYAIERGWYKKKRKQPFDFAYAYMPVPKEGSKFLERGYDTRQWRGQQMLTGITTPVEEAKKNGLPFSVKPNRKLMVQDITAILRDHFEGTEYGPAVVQQPLFISEEGECKVCKGMPREIIVNPNNTDERTISTMTTQFSTVAQLRADMPVNIGSLLWMCMGRPDCGVFVPWYAGILEVPKGFQNTPGVHDPVTALEHHFDAADGTFDYDPHANFWIYNDLENLVGAHYPKVIDNVQMNWLEIEDKLFDRQANYESFALQLWEENPRKANEFLTQWTTATTEQTLGIAKKLTREIKADWYR